MLFSWKFTALSTERRESKIAEIEMDKKILVVTG